MTTWMRKKEIGIMEKVGEKESIEYPCKYCIVRNVCSEICDKLFTEMKLKAIESKLQNHICPDCGHIKLKKRILNYSSVGCFKCESCNHVFKFIQPNDIENYVGRGSNDWNL